MSDDDRLRQAFTQIEVNDNYTEAVLFLSDASRLQFCHRVGERWVRAAPEPKDAAEPPIAQRILERIALFRLNAKHLEVFFVDGTRWEAEFSRRKRAADL